MAHTIEIFSAGCSVCKDAIELARRLAGAAQEARVLDMQRAETITRAREVGIGSVPAVVVDGKLAACCAGRGPDERVLRDALTQGPI